MFDVIDENILRERPTLMALHAKPLPVLETNTTRYIMGQGGLYIDSAPAWGRITMPLWKHRTELPYAPVEPVFSLYGGPIPTSILKHIFDDAIATAPVEYAGVVYWSPQNGYRYARSITLDATPGSIDYDLPPRQEGESLVLDVHSHGYGTSFFSHTDNEDDAGGIRIAAVLGKCTSYKKITMISRLCIEGHHIAIPYTEFLEI